MNEFLPACTLRVGDRFHLEDCIWHHCGWITAVDHIAGFNLQTGERRVISCHIMLLRVAYSFDYFCNGDGI